MMDSSDDTDSTRVDHEWTFHRVIPSDSAIGSVLINELLEAMMVREWSAAEQFRVQLAFEEAITNAIRHGNRNDASKKVSVEMKCDSERVWIQIADEGKGFDPSAVPDPRDSELIEVPGGRGVLLINEVMSSVGYNERGNQVTMTKIKGDKITEIDN